MTHSMAGRRFPEVNESSRNGFFREQIPAVIRKLTRAIRHSESLIGEQAVAAVSSPVTHD